jgi:DNA-binding CsgD family transcriptional regulator
LVAFTDQCLAHRSEILRLQGAWAEALDEAARSVKNKARGFVAAQAHYQEAEIHRMRGNNQQAEAAYEQVGRKGGDPQPGLALLRLSEGNEDAAVASVRRALAEARGLLGKITILPGYVEVMVATGHIEDAARAADELASLAAQTRIDVHQGWAATCAGWVSLATSSLGEAAASSRKAMRIWEDLGLPYQLACARKDLGIALKAMGDSDAGEVQLQEAKREFEELGAKPDVQAIEQLSLVKGAGQPFGLTGREREVLSLLASGATNRSIAERLVLSERTIDRHVSNIFTKLGVSTRSAATAYAIRNDVV